MKKGLLIGLVLVVAVVGFMMIQGKKAPEAPAPEEPKEVAEETVDVIKIGYLAALTGDWAAYGQTELNAAKLAVAEINAKGGVLGQQIQLFPYDFRTRPEDAVNAFRRLAENDKVVAVVGANGSGINIATAPLANKYGIPQIGTVSTNLLVTVNENGELNPFMFRTCFTDPYQGQAIAVFTAKELKKMTAAVLYDVGSDYSQGLREFFVQYFEEYGGKVVADQGFRAGTDVDFRAQLTTIRDSKAEVLVLPNMGKEMALIMKQARELGMNDIVFVGGDGYGEFMWEIAGDAMENSYWINHVAPEDPAMKDFFENYKKTYNDECKEFVNGILAYDSIYWLADAIERAGKVDSTAIKNALESTTDVQLHHAVMSIDPETHNPMKKTAVVLVAKDGRAQYFTKVKPE